MRTLCYLGNCFVNLDLFQKIKKSQQAGTHTRCVDREPLRPKTRQVQPGLEPPAEGEVPGLLAVASPGASLSGARRTRGAEPKHRGHPGRPWEDHSSPALPSGRLCCPQPGASVNQGRGPLHGPHESPATTAEGGGHEAPRARAETEVWTGVAPGPGSQRGPSLGVACANSPAGSRDGEDRASPLSLPHPAPLPLPLRCSLKEGAAVPGAAGTLAPGGWRKRGAES